MMDRDQVLEIANKMIVLGGSFDRAIGNALIVADGKNTEKLLAAFGENIERYKIFEKIERIS